MLGPGMKKIKDTVFEYIELSRQRGQGAVQLDLRPDRREGDQGVAGVGEPSPPLPPLPHGIGGVRKSTQGRGRMGGSWGVVCPRDGTYPAPSDVRRRAFRSGRNTVPTLLVVGCGTRYYSPWRRELHVGDSQILERFW